jgi:hypothetical protein
MGFSEIGPKGLPLSVSVAATRDGRAFTSPRVIIASQSAMPATTSSWAVSKMYVRRRTPIAAGRWAALIPVWVNFYQGTPGGGSAVAEMSNSLTPFEITCTLEMTNTATITAAASGTTSRTVSWENDSGTLFNVTFGGATSGECAPGDMIFGDPILASDVGLSYFEFTNRENFPFWRQAVQHVDGSTNLVLPNMGTGEYGFPKNTRGNAGTASNAGTTYADFVLDARRTGRTTGRAPNGVLSTEFGPAFILGIPLDGQKAVVVMGTSTPAGQGDGSFAFDWANTISDTLKNHVWDLSGLFGRVSTGFDETQFPIAQMAIGGTTIGPTWGEVKTTGSTTQMDQRASHPKLLAYTDLLIIGHDVNDSATADADFDRSYRRLLFAAKQMNPKIKTYYLERNHVNAYDGTNTFAPTEAGSTLSVQLNKYTNIAGFVTAGLLDGKVSIRPSTGAVGAMAPTGFLCSTNAIESGTATGGTTTSIVDSTKTWVGGRYTNAWIKITTGGTDYIRKISGHGTAWDTKSNTLVPASALSFAPNPGDPYVIYKCVQTDTLHLNAVGHTMAADIDLRAFFTAQGFPYFNRP